MGDIENEPTQSAAEASSSAGQIEPAEVEQPASEETGESRQEAAVEAVDQRAPEPTAEPAVQPAPESASDVVELPSPMTEPAESGEAEPVASGEAPAWASTLPEVERPLDATPGDAEQVAVAAAAAAESAPDALTPAEAGGPVPLEVTAADTTPAEGAAPEPEAPAPEPAEPAPGEAPATAEPATAEAPATAESLDEIQPAAAPVGAAPEAEPLARPVTVPWWPFLVYLGLWAVLVGLAVWQFMQIPAGQAIFETPIYRITILGGLVMTAAGALVILAVWLGSAFRKGATHRVHMFVDALIKGAITTFAGVLIWWIALIVVDYLRLGRTF